MKYAIVKVSNGNFSIHVEKTDLNAAKVAYHGLCQSLWNATEVVTAEVAIMNENLNVVSDGSNKYCEFISHPVPDTSTPAPDTTE